MIALLKFLGPPFSPPVVALLKDLGRQLDIERPSWLRANTVCVILSLMARGEIMLCAKVCWWVGRGGFSDPCRKIIE
jgi:hypothetical protein